MTRTITKLLFTLLLAATLPACASTHTVYAPKPEDIPLPFVGEWESLAGDLIRNGGANSTIFTKDYKSSEVLYKNYEYQDQKKKPYTQVSLEYKIISLNQYDDPISEDPDGSKRVYADLFLLTKLNCFYDGQRCIESAAPYDFMLIRYQFDAEFNKKNNLRDGRLFCISSVSRPHAEEEDWLHFNPKALHKRLMNTMGPHAKFTVESDGWSYYDDYSYASRECFSTRNN